MNNLDEIRPVWVEINLDNLAYNMQQIRKHTNEKALVMAVVKADGYGHGAVETSKTFLDNGADSLAVATLSEGIELRMNDISHPILILGYTPPCQYEKLLKYDLSQTIFTYEDGVHLSKKAMELNTKAIIHIKIDSGMGRIGFLPTANSIEDIMRISVLPGINIEGVYTHFAKADEKDKSYSKHQFQVFTTMVNELEDKGLYIPIKHVSNSAGIIDLPDYNLNMVRAGIMMYGYYPSHGVEKENIRLKPAMTLKAKISNLKNLPKGTGISYGQIFVTEKQSKIATIPIGYADGFTRLLTHKAEVYLKGQRAKQVGKICMDQCMIDVSHIEDIGIGEEVVIFGHEKGHPSVEELGEKIGTINYEIICMVGRRVPRVYTSEGKISKIRDYLLD